MNGRVWIRKVSFGCLPGWGTTFAMAGCSAVHDARRRGEKVGKVSPDKEGWRCWWTSEVAGEDELREVAPVGGGLLGSSKQKGKTTGGDRRSAT
jgi:hypothetical protein